MSLKILEISKSYGQQKALKNISFSVEKGEIVGFLGPNGAGKSTLMKILTGYVPASSGTAEISGFNVTNDTLDVQRRIGYLPEDNPLYTEMYVREYLGFQAKVFNVDKTKIESVIDDTGLTPEANKKISEL